MKQKMLLAVVLMFCSHASMGHLSAQDFTYQVSSAQSWTDTGLDLQSGDNLQISQSAVTSSSTDPACGQKPASEAPAQPADLPLPSAPEGALLARLHAQGALPVLVSNTELHIEESSHLFLGLNLASRPACGTNVTVKVHRTPAVSPSAGSASTSSTSGAAGPSAAEKNRGQQLKSQLSIAAQIFMSGQFGSGKSETASASSNATSSADTTGTTATPAPVLNVSDTPLDADLRKVSTACRAASMISFRT